MHMLENKDYALTVLIGGIVFFFGYCGVYYMELTQPGPDPGLLAGAWKGTNIGFPEEGCTLNFYPDHTYTMTSNGELLEGGSWEHLRGNQYVIHNDVYNTLDYAVNGNTLNGLFCTEVWVRA